MSSTSNAIGEQRIESFEKLDEVGSIQAFSHVQYVKFTYTNLAV